MLTPILAIETSCDETAVAVVDAGYRVRANEIRSQVEEHARFGGVVPEIASRSHLQALPGLVDRALSCAGVEPRAVAVTRGPGLVGSLIVGVAFAKAFGRARGIPVHAVHHIAGHIHAVLLDRPDWEPPFLALVVSGGHTEIVRVPRFGVYERGSRTIDDAAGEAFDKAARLLGLGFPGGPALARLAAAARAPVERLTGPLMRHSRDFSFSGLKTALRNRLAKEPPMTEEARASLAASFEAAVVENLVAKTAAALDETGEKRLVLAGGVAANARLRREMEAMARTRSVEIAIPSPLHCTDNAAMIGAAALAYGRGPMDLSDSALASWELQ